MKYSDAKKKKLNVKIILKKNMSNKNVNKETVSDLGQGGAPDAVGLHAAGEKLLPQTHPLGLGGTDLCGSPGFSQLLALSGGSLYFGL